MKRFRVSFSRMTGRAISRTWPSKRELLTTALPKGVPGAISTTTATQSFTSPTMVLLQHQRQGCLSDCSMLMLASPIACIAIIATELLPMLPPKLGLQIPSSAFPLGFGTATMTAIRLVCRQLCRQYQRCSSPVRWSAANGGVGPVVSGQWSRGVS